MGVIFQKSVGFSELYIPVPMFVIFYGIKTFENLIAYVEKCQGWQVTKFYMNLKFLVKKTHFKNSLRLSSFE